MLDFHAARAFLRSRTGCVALSVAPRIVVVCADCAGSARLALAQALRRINVSGVRGLGGFHGGGAHPVMAPVAPGQDPLRDSPTAPVHN